jgi:DNA-binding NtrC family response regulator
MKAHLQILYVDDDQKAGELMLRFCEDQPYGCRVFSNPQQALEFFLEQGADIIITDLRMPHLSGTELLAKIREHNTEIPVIITTAYSTVDDAIEALRLGAADFIKKPFDMDELMLLVDKTLENTRLRQENALLKQQLRDVNKGMNMVGDSAAMQTLYETLRKVAEIRCNVIIEGESGTGKELAARAIHEMSPEADLPFVVIDCGALTDTLLESELFGYEKGAFTGANQTRQGLLEVASGGSVFLDEICNISDNMQVKLLRVVQEQQVTRVGGVHPIDIDLRFIVATNQNLEKMVAEGKFRHDLYHRLNVIKVQMPALRDHREDIPQLCQHFVDYFNQRYHRHAEGFDAQSLQYLRDYHWPGNIRELRNTVERAMVLADGPQLHVPPLTEQISTMTNHDAIDSDLPTIEELERRYLFKVLEHFNGNREKTADSLGINKSTLWRKLQQYRAQ